MKENTKWYWEQTQKQNNIIITKCTILHPCLDVLSVTHEKQIPKSVCNRNQARKDLQRQPICLTDSDHYFILGVIKRRETVEYDRYMSVDNKQNYFT